MDLELSTMPGAYSLSRKVCNNVAISPPPSGAVYEGEWHHNKKHGKGWYMSHTGVVTNGLFRDDQLVGEGLDRPVTPISRLTAGTYTATVYRKISENHSAFSKF